MGTQKEARKLQVKYIPGKYYRECKDAFLPCERIDSTNYLICLFSYPSVSVTYSLSAQCPTLAVAKPTNFHGM